LLKKLFPVLLLSILIGSAAHAADPTWLMSNQEERELMPARVREAYNNQIETMNNEIGKLGQMFGGGAYDAKKIDPKVPLIMTIDENGTVYTMSSPFAEDATLKSLARQEGVKYYTFVAHLDEKSVFAGRGKYMQLSGGRSTYNTMMDAPLTKYVLGQLNYNTASFFNTIENAQDENLREYGKKFIEKWNGADGLDKKLKEGQDRIRKIFMLQLPLGLLVLTLLVQLGLAMYELKPGVSFPGILLRWTAYVVAILTYERWIGFTIDFFSVMTNALVPAETQEYVVQNLLSVASLADFGGSSWFIGWLMDVVRYLGYMAVQILMIMRDVFLAITVIFGPVVIAISFPSSVSGKSALDFGRGMLSGWIEGFVRLMLWCPIGAACIVLLGATTMLAGIGATGVLATVVMTVAMMFACTKVPDLSEKMSGQGLAAVFAVLGGSVTSAGGSAVGGAVSVSGSVLAGTGKMVFHRGAVVGAFSGIGSLINRFGSGSRNVSSKMVDEAQQGGSQQEAPRVDVRKGPVT